MNHIFETTQTPKSILDKYRNEKFDSKKCIKCNFIKAHAFLGFDVFYINGEEVYGDFAEYLEIEDFNISCDEFIIKGILE